MKSYFSCYRGRGRVSAPLAAGAFFFIATAMLILLLLCLPRPMGQLQLRPPAPNPTHNWTLDCGGGIRHWNIYHDNNFKYKLYGAAAARSKAKCHLAANQVPASAQHRAANKTLIITMGNLRGGERAWQSMYKHVLDVNCADLAITISKGELQATTSSMIQRASYVWAHNEYADWGTALDEIGGDGGWRQIALKNKGTGLLGGTQEDPEGSGAIIFWFRWFVSKQIRRLKLDEAYDRFIVTRSDYYYGCAHDISDFDPNFVWIPLGEDYCGYTDRHIVASKSNVLKALNIVPPLVLNPGKYVGFEGNPERLIKLRLEEESVQVQRFPRMMFTCAVPGDQTRWRKMKSKPVAEGVNLKYEKEYYETKRVCSLI